MNYMKQGSVYIKTLTMNTIKMEKREQVIVLLNKCIMGESVANTADKILELFDYYNNNCDQIFSKSADIDDEFKEWEDATISDRLDD